MVKIACQTIVFGNPVIKDTIADILKVVSRIGYDGVEVGIRHFYLDRVNYYKDLLEENHLLLPAVHMGGDFLDQDSVKTQLRNYEQTLAFAKELGCEYIYLSGAHHNGKNVDDYKKESKIYNDMGRRCREMGMKLCYHNHDWEIVNQQAGINILLAETDPENFRLVPDVGWLTVANADPVKFIADHMDRVESLHFKEFKPIREFTELGKGMVNFKGVYDLYRASHEDFWVVAEQDETELGGPVSARENFEYINNLRAQG